MNHDKSIQEAWRWIEDGPASGGQNMTVDETLALSAEPLDPPILRVYAWDPPAISLGFHQPLGSIDLVRCEADGIDVVKRPTGGRAVLHHEELTYSVVIPSGHPLYRFSIPELHRKIGLSLVQGIRLLGVPAELSRPSVDWASHYRTAMASGCFSATSKDEITLDGRKLVGSAQRRYASAVLQHGSILIGDAHLRLPDYLAGLSENEKHELGSKLREKTVSLSSRGCSTGPETLTRALRSAFEETMGVRFQSVNTEILNSAPAEAACRP